MFLYIVAYGTAVCDAAEQVDAAEYRGRKADVASKGDSARHSVL